MRFSRRPLCSLHTSSRPESLFSRCFCKPSHRTGSPASIIIDRSYRDTITPRRIQHNRSIQLKGYACQATATKAPATKARRDNSHERYQLSHSTPSTTMASRELPEGRNPLLEPEHAPVRESHVRKRAGRRATRLTFVASQMRYSWSEDAWDRPN